MKSCITYLILFLALVTQARMEAQTNSITTRKKFFWGTSYAYQVSPDLFYQFHYTGCSFGTDAMRVESGMLAGRNKLYLFYKNESNFYDPGLSKGLYLNLSYALRSRTSWFRPYVNLLISYLVSDAKGSYNYGNLDPCIPLPGYTFEHKIQSLNLFTALGLQFRFSKRFYFTNELMLGLLNSTKKQSTFEYDGISEPYKSSSAKTGLLSRNFGLFPLFSLQFGLSYRFH